MSNPNIGDQTPDEASEWKAPDSAKNTGQSIRQQLEERGLGYQNDIHGTNKFLNSQVGEQIGPEFIRELEDAMRYEEIERIKNWEKLNDPDLAAIRTKAEDEIRKRYQFGETRPDQVSLKAQIFGQRAVDLELERREDLESGDINPIDESENADLGNRGRLKKFTFTKRQIESIRNI